MTQSIMRRLQPTLAMEQKQFDTQMANQGIPLGSEAYENARRMFDQRQNDKLVSSVIQGTQTGLQARGQGFSEQAYQRNEPINTLNAVRSGSQVTNPNSFFVSAPQQATTAGADMLGAAGMTGNANIAAANATNAQRNAMISGLFNIGAAAAGGA
jgi:Zn-dependent alcohol dehydrogenase